MASPAIDEAARHAAYVRQRTMIVLGSLHRRPGIVFEGESTALATEHTGWEE